MDEIIVDFKMKELEFCVDNNITTPQFNFLFIVYAFNKTVDKYGTKHSILLNMLNTMKKYKSWVAIPGDKFIPDGDKFDLIEKGLLHYINPDLDKEELNVVRNFKLGKTFIDMFDTTIDLDICAKEFFDTYPGFIQTPKGNLTLKSCSYPEFKELYLTQIKYNVETHKKVLNILNHAKTNGLINTSIMKFVSASMWNDVINFSKTVVNRGVPSYRDKSF